MSDEMKQFDRETIDELLEAFAQAGVLPASIEAIEEILIEKSDDSELGLFFSQTFTVMFRDGTIDLIRGSDEASAMSDFGYTDDSHKGLSKLIAGDQRKLWVWDSEWGTWDQKYK